MARAEARSSARIRIESREIWRRSGRPDGAAATACGPTGRREAGAPRPESRPGRIARNAGPGDAARDAAARGRGYRRLGLGAAILWAVSWLLSRAAARGCCSPCPAVSSGRAQHAFSDSDSRRGTLRGPGREESFWPPSGPAAPRRWPWRSAGCAAAGAARGAPAQCTQTHYHCCIRLEMDRAKTMVNRSGGRKPGPWQNFRGRRVDLVVVIHKSRR